MAEVKTFKCDICGEVYYSDDVKTDMMIGMRSEDKDSVKCKSYDHICPRCVGNFNELISKPDLLEKLGNTVQKLKIGLRGLYNKIVYNHGTLIVSMDDSTIDNVFAGIVRELDVARETYSQKQKELAEVKSSSTFWKRLASIFIGLTTSMIIVLILRVIV